MRMIAAGTPAEELPRPDLENWSVSGWGWSTSLSLRGHAELTASLLLRHRGSGELRGNNVRLINGPAALEAAVHLLLGWAHQVASASEE